MTSAQARQLSRVLMIAIAIMAGIYVLLLAGLGRGVPGVGSTPPDQVPALVLSETQVELPGLQVYSDIANRPVFSEDRQPVVKIDEQAGEQPEPEPEAPTAPLNIALTGIIHTPQMRIALMRDNGTGTALSLQEDMFLPGDQGGWQVKEIEPLRVVFLDSASQSETAVELELGKASTAAAPPPRARPQQRPSRASTQPTAPDAAASGEDEVAQRAAEIRRRIEERRAQLRREAGQAQ